MKPIRKARLRKRYIVVSKVVFSRLTELKTLRFNSLPSKELISNTNYSYTANNM